MGRVCGHQQVQAEKYVLNVTNPSKVGGSLRLK